MLIPNRKTLRQLIFGFQKFLIMCPCDETGALSAIYKSLLTVNRKK